MKHYLSLVYAALTIKKDKPLDPTAEGEKRDADLEKGELSSMELLPTRRYSTLGLVSMVKGQNDKIFSPVHSTPSPKLSQEAAAVKDGVGSKTIEVVEPENVLAVPQSSTALEENVLDSIDLVKDSQDTVSMQI